MDKNKNKNRDAGAPMPIDLESPDGVEESLADDAQDVVVDDSLDAAEQAKRDMDFVAPEAPGPIELRLRISRDIGLGAGTRKRNHPLGTALSHPDNHAVIDLETIEWIAGSDPSALSKSEHMILLDNPHLIEITPIS